MSQLNIDENIVDNDHEDKSLGEGEGSRKRKGNAGIALQLKKIKLLEDLFGVSSLQITPIFNKYNYCAYIIFRTQKQ